MGFSQDQVYHFGVPVTRTIAFGGLHWDLPPLGNHHILEVTSAGPELSEVQNLAKFRV